MGPAINRVTSKKAKKTYIKVALSCKSVAIHIVVATQWIPEDDPKKNIVDHVRSDCADYRVESLRWVTQSLTSRNRATIKHEPITVIESLPEGFKRILVYKDKLVGNDTSQFYTKDEIVYKYNATRFVEKFELLKWDTGNKIRLGNNKGGVLRVSKKSWEHIITPD
jgi:hypothetical protein